MKKLLNIFIPLGIISGGILTNAVIANKLKKDCNELLTNCKIYLDRIKIEWTKILDSKLLKDDERQFVEQKLINIVDAANNKMVKGRNIRNLKKARDLYKEAHDSLKEASMMLVIKNIGWFYN